jgi:hypothetical protein
MRRHPLYEQDRLLNGTLGFTDEDLAANQDGYISDKQRLRLKRERRKWKFFIVVTLLAYPFGWMLIVFPETYRPATAGIGVWFGASVTIFICWLFMRDFDQDLAEGKTQVIRGAIKLGQQLFTIGGQGQQSHYYLRIENMNWTMRKSPFLAFADGDSYAIYYAPHSKTLLSAEWLGSEPE